MAALNPGGDTHQSPAAIRITAKYIPGGSGAKNRLGTSHNK